MREMEKIMGPILGQEAVVSPYGLGRVTQISDKKFHGNHIFIGVTPYICNYQMKFDPRNVRLVSITVGGNP